MKKILFTVEPVIYYTDGYRSRIEMELDILGEDNEYIMLAPDLGGSTSKTISPFKNHRVQIIYYHSFREDVPYLLNKSRMSAKLCDILKTGDISAVYCEALPSAIMSKDAASAFGVPLIYDCHGTAPDEIRMLHNNIPGKIYASYMVREEKKVLSSAALTITVSENQYRHWRTDADHCLLPMLVSAPFLSGESHRDEIRKKLGVSEDTRVFVYSGQAQKWQMAEETLKYYKMIEENLKDTFLLILTGDRDIFRSLARQLELSHVKIMSLKHDEVPGYLDACDYGFCLRKKDPVNLAASPTKVMEYMSRGVKPVLTPWVGDWSRVLEKRGLSVTVKDLTSMPDDFYNDISDGEKRDMSGFVNRLGRKLSREYKERILQITDSDVPGDRTGSNTEKRHMLDLSGIHATELDIMLYFQNICRQYNLKFYLCGGTMLGAARHRGFIPWDDDVDLVMPRPDYDRLISLERKKHIISKPYKMYAYELENADFPFIKICDTRTHLRQQYVHEDEANSHLWIDVQPADGEPEDSRELERRYKRLSRLRTCYTLCFARLGQGQGRFRTAAKYVLVPLARIPGPRFWSRRIISISRKYDYGSSEHVGIVGWGIYGPGESCLKKEYDREVTVTFEGHEMPAMSCWDSYLKALYGDYMKLPPESQRRVHMMEAWRD